MDGNKPLWALQEGSKVAHLAKDDPVYGWVPACGVLPFGETLRTWTYENAPIAILCKRCFKMCDQNHSTITDQA